jgi:PKD repeat protein
MINTKVLTILIVLTLTNFSVQWAVPNAYIANQKTSQTRSDILWIFVQIKAYKKTNNAISPSLFKQLSDDFESIFPYLPQKPEFKIVYEQCKITTASLSQVYQLANYIKFENQCFNPLNSIITEINNKYTIVTQANANPNKGNVPMTVTFDGRWSTDPTNETIPETNYFRRFRDIDGVEKAIGIWPIVNYTFTKPWNYIINFVARSIHNLDGGIFDGQKKLTITAEPQIANISVYLWSKKLNDEEPVKISTTEVQQGIRIDGSSTSPRWGRVIVAHKWDIYSSNQTTTRGTVGTALIYSKSLQWTPTSFVTTLPSSGGYRIRLSITDNQWANTYQEYVLVVSDPVAIIKTNPKSWNTSNRFTFDAGASYSVTSRIKSYTREIYNQDGEKIDTLTEKTFNKQFLIPGIYTVKLIVTDMDDKITQEQSQVQVDSTPPNAQYTITASTSLQKPSQFLLDASNSSDVDLISNHDKLSYSWILLSESENGSIVTDKQDIEKAIITFEKKWTYAIKLTVKDQYQKTSEIIKNITISSALRPEVTANPVTAPWWTNVNFTVTANKSVKYYNYDFGDGEKLTNRNKSTVSHIYKKTGIYKVKITTISADDQIEENTVTTNIFVTNKEEPSLWYKIIKNDKFNTIMQTSGNCPWIDSEVYTISRYQAITIDTADSVNTQWKKEKLNIYFAPQNGSILTNKKNLTNYKFDELWCQYIDISIEDTNILKTINERIRFNIINTPPTIGNIKMSFPQYGNEIGIWFSNGNFRDVFSTTNVYDPLIVKLVGNGIKDPDGYIKYLTRYYYRTDDPTNRIWLKTTPSSTNFMYFSIPRIAWEYSFGVEMIDNDETKNNSQEIIGDWPIVFFPPNKNDGDIPIITFKVDQNNIKVWEEVNFQVISKILSDKQDFNSSKTIKYDFDGDGEYDLTTKDDNIKYTYSKAWSYKPRAKVTYRGKSSSLPLTQDINVEQWLKTDFMYANIGKTAIIRNTSIWQIKNLTRCLDIKKCNSDNNYVIEQSDYHTFKYAEYGSYAVRLDAKDEYGNSQSIRKVISIQPNDLEETATSIKTIPEWQIKWKNIEITVGKQLKNTILFYVQHNENTPCFIDTNILVDTNYNGIQDDDKNIKCNELASIVIESNTSDLVARLVHGIWSWRQTKDILINLIDNKPLVLDKYKDTYEQLDSIIKTLSTDDEQSSFMKTLLLQLKWSLWDKNDVASLILQIKDLIENPDLKIAKDTKDQINKIIVWLSDAPIIAAQWISDYESYKGNIKLLLKWVNENFIAIEQASGDQKIIKTQLDEIYQFAQLKTKSSWVDSIDNTDFEEIAANLCEIANYYQIATKTCGNSNNIENENNTLNESEANQDRSTSTTTVRSKIVKIILIIFGVVVLVFLWLIIIFAIKAKREQQSDTPETTTP